MQLEQAQKEKVSAWIAEGRSLSEIQKLLDSELNLRLTYLEVRFLVDDLKLTPKDTVHAEAPKPVVAPAAGQAAPAPGQEAETPAEEAAGLGGVSVTVDTLTRPGAMVSGGVTFSDGKKAKWYLDQTGRLGLAPEQQGYRPSAEDVQEFQMLLQRELQGMG